MTRAVAGRMGELVIRLRAGPGSGRWVGGVGRPGFISRVLADGWPPSWCSVVGCGCSGDIGPVGES
jgi:hypothetical protein